eukprot:scaffold116573_cov48-Phaeocystis_antarctica.AAC.1
MTRDEAGGEACVEIPACRTQTPARESGAQFRATARTPSESVPFHTQRHATPQAAAEALRAVATPPPSLASS